MVCESEIESIHGFFDLDIVIHSGREAKRFVTAQSIVDGQNGADIIDDTGLGIIK